MVWGASLKNFARLDEAQVQKADLHEGIESTLTLLDHELKQAVQVERDYDDIPLVQCIPSQLNQVFMNVLMNACHAVKKTSGGGWVGQSPWLDTKIFLNTIPVILKGTGAV